MSQNKPNDEVSGIAYLFAFISVGAIMLAAVAFVVLAFLALALTVVCLFAWNRTVSWGSFTMTPQEARGFVYRGLIGSALLSAFCVFAAILFNIRIEDQAIPYILLAGYTLGSLGVEYLRAQGHLDAPPHQTILPPEQQIAPPPRIPEPPTLPFRFASWNDEDGR